MDIHCQMCGEPWDSYGITYSIGDGSMTAEEAADFRKGLGCPACENGAICKYCGGTGLEPSDSILVPDCSTCNGQRKIILSRHIMAVVWDYLPKKWTISNPTLIRKSWEETYTNGRFVFHWALCPDCSATAPKCTVCKGDGKFRKRQTDAEQFRAMAELMEASDDSDSILEDLGL